MIDEAAKEAIQKTKEDIIARSDLFELCQALGLEPKNKVARCPWHSDQGRPNLAIYPDNVHCFQCGEGGDAFELVMKVKGYSFKEAFDFLAARLGLPLIEDARPKGRRLGNGNGATPAKTYPKPAPLPTTPSPTLGAKVEPEADPGDQVSPSLPADLWRDFDDFGEAWIYFQSQEDYRRGLAKEGDRFVVRAIDASGRVVSRRRSLRVDVFAALLALGPKASTTAAGAWLQREKGIELATQDRFGLVYLDDPRAAAGELVKTFGLDALLAAGIYAENEETKKPYFNFKTHRLLFPFFWKGEPVDVQGRDVDAADKNKRFRNTKGKNPIPYNADDILAARATGAPVFLCEGATDTLTLAQSGRLVVGIVGTGGFKAAWVEAFDDLAVFLAFDNDDAGRGAAKSVTKVFVEAGRPAPKTIKLPEGIKDITEFFRSNTQ